MMPLDALGVVDSWDFDEDLVVAEAVGLDGGFRDAELVGRGR